MTSDKLVLLKNFQAQSSIRVNRLTIVSANSVCEIWDPELGYKYEDSPYRGFHESITSRPFMLNVGI